MSDQEQVPEKKDSQDEELDPKALEEQIKNMEESPRRRLFWRVYGITTVALTALLVILLYAGVFPPDVAGQIRSYAIFVFMALIVTFVIFRQKR